MIERIQKIFKLKNRKTSIKRKNEYGECQTCNRCNTDYSWCQSCDPQLLTEGWTSGNETIDKLIKNTQLKATKYDNSYYLQWIPYDKLEDIEKIDEGGFATLYHATWINGWKYIDNNNKKCIENSEVALKKLHNSQNISDEFLNEVNKFIIIIFFLYLYKKIHNN